MGGYNYDYDYVYVYDLIPGPAEERPPLLSDVPCSLYGTNAYG